MRPQVKIVTRGTDDQVTAVRMELCSENNIFFLYSHAVEAETFHKLKYEQRLIVDINQYPKMLVRMLNQVCWRQCACRNLAGSGDCAP